MAHRASASPASPDLQQEFLRGQQGFRGRDGNVGGHADALEILPFDRIPDLADRRPAA
jgi:hypothetical protein